MSTGSGDKPGGGSSPGRPAADTPGRLVVRSLDGTTDTSMGAGDTAVAVAEDSSEHAMLETIGKADLGEQRARARRIRIALLRRAGRDEGRSQDVLEHRALRQQRMVLKHEADALVAKRRLLALAAPAASVGTSRPARSSQAPFPTGSARWS